MGTLCRTLIKKVLVVPARSNHHDIERRETRVGKDTEMVAGNRERERNSNRGETVLSIWGSLRKALPLISEGQRLGEGRSFFKERNT